MKFSVNWLREFVDLPENPEEIADLLTRAGVETENIETRGAKIDKLIVSQVTASSRHPNADRLTVCEVDDGSGTKRQIVCGATNYKVGDKVPLALPGAKLRNGTKIKSMPREMKMEIRRSGVTIAATHECPFFSARKIDNVKVGPSPQWLRAKVESVGIRSINNIVDISNLVMLELGQPTHAFDADKLNGGINVRLARDGEEFLALDGKTYSLKPDNLVVADQECAVGIGGVMGGEETGVTDSTKNILLEAAYFLPASIRRTARGLNLP